MSEKQPLYLVVSLDVEEEGLFGGHYARRGFTTRNTSGLKDLASFCGMGIRPTLFCAHSALSDPASCETLAWLRDAHHAEIGAHLHHWNTPPLTLDGTDHTLPDTAARVPAADVSDALFSAKLAALMEAGKALQGPPMTSFRMGRWDLHRNHWPLLAAAGILCDASVRPLHSDEVTYWPHMLRLACLRFWLSRLLAAEQPRSEAVLVKDPAEFQQRLAQRFASAPPNLPLAL